MAEERVDVDEERRRLESRGLSRADLDPDPLVMLRRWFDHAARVGVHQPEAMSVATVSRDGVPSVRLVLCKGFDERGVVFYTNQRSRKGRELRADPATLRARIEERASPRDTEKLTNWPQFLAATHPDTPPPVPHFEVDNRAQAPPLTAQVAAILRDLGSSEHGTVL